MVAGISISVDSREVVEALDKLSSRDTSKSLQRALKKGGNFLAGRTRAEAPGKPRRYKSKIRARNAKRDKPGVVVSAKHRLNVIIQGGTRDRYTRSGAYRGRIKANPFVTRTADRYGDEALDIAERAISDELDL
jgi:hypothetical protein